MALTNQPYLPLYVDDWMNNNKLKMCSPAAHGLMVSIMCIMHKEKTYGRVLLKQKFKQTESNVKNFALQIAKLSAFEITEIEKPFNELIAEGSLKIDENYLICPRMVRDFETSEKRAVAGRKGGTTPKVKKQIKAKGEANTVNENGIEDVNVNAVEKGKEGNGIGSGIMGMTKAAWGFVANPIGAILTAIVVAVQLGMAVFKNFTPVVEKVEQIMASLGAVVESVKNAFIGLFTGDASNFFSNLTTGAAEAASEAMKLKEAEQELAKQMELQEIANEKAKNSIDELIAKSKDQTLSEEERIKALQDAAKKELENFNQRKAQVIEEERIATQKLANGKNLTANELKMLKEKGAEYAYELQRKNRLVMKR